jgi:hypothetical protein
VAPSQQTRRIESEADAAADLCLAWRDGQSKSLYVLKTEYLNVALVCAASLRFFTLNAVPTVNFHPYKARDED